MEEQLRDRYAPDKVLETWLTMMRAVKRMNERELERALTYELANAKRRDVILRIHRKFTRMRKERELKEYLKDAT